MDTPANDLTVAMPTADDDPALVASAIDAAIAQPLANPLLIVDMSAGDAVQAVASARGQAVQYVRFAESRGAADSRNRILELAETRYVLCLDADTLPQAGWAAAMRSTFDRSPGVALVAARCVAIWPSGGRPPLFGTAPAADLLSLLDLGETPVDVPRVMGSSFALDRERVADIRFELRLGFGPHSRLAGEEVAFSEAVRRRGWRIRYEPRAVVGHHIGTARAHWRWMWRRGYRAGCEAALWERPLEPLPRRLSASDYAFLALVAPAMLAGRVASRLSPSAPLNN